MKNEFDISTVLERRLQRQRLAAPLTTSDDYLELFRLLQPVATKYNARPGDPPCLIHRTHFDDSVLTEELRAERVIVKGRFLNGTVGYVLADDLAIYANAFCRPLTSFNEKQIIVFETVRALGPVTPNQIKDETGLRNKDIMPALHRLQKAFLVYEDQINTDWERSWYDFASEWPQVRIEDEQWMNAARQVLTRFLQGHVFATLEQIRDWAHFPVKRLKALLADMEKKNLIVPRSIQGLGDGWILDSDDYTETSKVTPSVFMLHKGDSLVRSHASELKRRFGEYETLQYLLIDGQFQGAVVGHWRIGPHDVEDIVVELPTETVKARRDEILNAVALGYYSPFSHILKYAGKDLRN